jgi:predicted AAA+ superfamily ATPase
LERGIHLIIWLKVAQPAKQLIKLKIIKSKKLKHLIATMIILSTLTNKSSLMNKEFKQLTKLSKNKNLLEMTRIQFWKSKG